MKYACFSGWDQLPDSGSTLFEKGEKKSIFLSRQWFESLSATALNGDQTLVLACVVADNTVMALLPLMKSTGSTWYSLKHQYTPVYSLLLADANQQRILGCLAQGLSRLALKGLLLEPVADNDGNLDSLQRIMETAGFSCDRVFRHYNWILRVQGQSFENYMAARPAKLRNTISRKKRKLDREHGYEIRLFTDDTVPQAMDDYYAVYNASWKANEQYIDFMDAIVERFSRMGWCRLGILYIKGQPAAAQLWFVLHGKASIFRLAYDEAWRRYSPGSILTSFLTQYVIDVDEVEEIDFLTGNDAYKQDWMSERRQCFALSCVKIAKPAGRFERFVESVKLILKKRK